MKIIDFDKHGNVVRFYFGKDELTNWYGDDWNDHSYEHNAGTVYDEFVDGYLDVAWDCGHLVLEPADGVLNSEYCKDDMCDRKTPCVIIVCEKLAADSWYDDRFSHYIGVDQHMVDRIYFGDPAPDKQQDTFRGGKVLKYHRN